MKLNIGYMPLVDAAPLIIADAMGIFNSLGLEVSLRKLQSWQQMQTRYIAGSLDAIHSLATMIISMNTPTSSLYCPSSYALCLNKGGSAITISNRLWKQGVRKAEHFSEELIFRLKRNLTFGVVHPLSNHEFLLRSWLTRSQLKIGYGIELKYFSPHHMVKKLRTGEIDGYCCGEPWNQRASLAKTGGLIDWGDTLNKVPLDKVLAVKTDWHDKNVAIHRKLVQACVLASNWLSDSDNLLDAASIISNRKYVNTKMEIVKNCLEGKINAGFNREFHDTYYLEFSNYASLKPSLADLNWYVFEMSKEGYLSMGDMVSIPLHDICLTDFFEETFPSSIPFNSIGTSVTKEKV